MKDTAERWFTGWSLYLVLAVAAFLRFFRLQTFEFDSDQANLFQLARDTFTHGLIPLSSNQASIGTLHAPFFTYLLLPAAAISANPLGAAIIVSLLTTAAAGLTYLFTRRYFGRLPALMAGLLYATNWVVLRYSRGIWQPDLLTFFLLLFLIAVYRGAVERKHGWFAPAVALLAILYQLDPSSIVAPGLMLALALLVAPRTLRWRDLVFAAGALIVLFFPYLLLQLLTNFADVNETLAFLRLPSHTDGQVLGFYRVMLFPFTGILPVGMTILGYCLDVLLIAGLLVAIMRLVRPREQDRQDGLDRQETTPAGATADRWRRMWRVWASWQRFSRNPERAALVLLLVWQVVPFIALIQHSVDLHMQYLLVFLPGPFILMGLAVDESVLLMRNLRHNWGLATQIGVLLMSALLITGQFLGTSASLIETTGGSFDDRTIQSALSYTNDLNSLWNAVHQADTLAQQRHIPRLFISMDGNIQPAMSYLSATLRTPTTVFGYDDCLTLPASGTGPAVYLIGPYASDLDALLHQFATATLVAQPPRLGGQPFHLYIVTPNATAPQMQAATTMRVQDKTLAVTRWTIERTAFPSPRMLYNYQFTTPVASQTSQAAITTTCAATALHRGDQMIVALPVASSATTVTHQNIRGAAFDTLPAIYPIGPLRFTAFLTQTINRPFAADVRWST